MGKIRRALVSVSDKSGITDFAQTLASMDVEILSTGGTARALREAGIAVKDVSEYTGFPEMMDGRVKTLHPKVHGGLLGRRDNDKDLEDMQRHGIEPIDMVVVNLYPFEQTISKEGVTFAEAIENIDIGGPTMLRSAAKNFKDVAVVVDPADYAHIEDELRNMGGELGYRTKARLARKVFQHTSRYDTLIAQYLSGVEEDAEAFPMNLTLTYRRTARLRYGENPHQRAAAYAERSAGLSLFDAESIQGKEMSFDNYYDTHSALILAREFESPACAIIKHNNPCGVALGRGTAEAYSKALKTDPVSAFGGVVAFNAPVDGETAKEVTSLFVEVVIAPDFTEEAISVFSAKPDIRVLRLPGMKDKTFSGLDLKRVAGGIIVQEWDTARVDVMSLQAVTAKQPTEEERRALDFAWRVAKHVSSNAIVYATGDRTVGIGIGQTSRVYSTRAGAINALESLNGTVVASDGFFPFRDGIDSIKKVGVTAVIQPGGSVKDAEVIKAAEEHGIAMLFTGVRHFRH